MLMKSKCIARFVRSGQQEGLSFTNTDLVQNVDFLQEVFKQSLATNYHQY
jgi:hypothetical protein